MRQCRTKGREDSQGTVRAPPSPGCPPRCGTRSRLRCPAKKMWDMFSSVQLLGERAGVRASISSNLIFRVRGSEPALFAEKFEPRYLGCHKEGRFIPA